MANIIFGGVEYVPITQELYDEMAADLAASQRVRFEAVENFRLWCELNKGVHTVEEGLAACTPEELQHQYYVCGGHISSMVSGFIDVLVHRLAMREEQRAAELARVAVTPIMPDDEEDNEDEPDAD